MVKSSQPNKKEVDNIRIKKAYWSFIFWLKAVWLGIKASPKIQLGSRVVYEEEVHTVINGIWANHWLIDGLPQDSGVVFKKDCKRVKKLKEWKHSFKTTYRWWMTSWHSIEVNKKIYPEAFKPLKNSVFDI